MFLYIAFAGAVAAANGFGSFLTKMVLIAVFGVVSWWVVRPALDRILPDGPGRLAVRERDGIVFAGMLLFGLIGDRIGIHALVGGFVWGLILPNDRALRLSISAKVKDVAMIMFLPVFFALAGFSADLKLLTPATFGVVALVLAAAIVGKFLAAVPARAFGVDGATSGCWAPSSTREASSCWSRA